MKKSLRKIASLSLEKLRMHKEQIKKYSLSNLAKYREDFVITAQEEREGGYFGSRMNLKQAI